MADAIAFYTLAALILGLAILVITTRNGVPVHIRDMNATVLNQLGVDHDRLTFRFQGLNQRPTGVEPAHVVQDILV